MSVCLYVWHSLWIILCPNRCWEVKKKLFFRTNFLTRSKDHNSKTKLISLKLTIQLHHKNQKNWKKNDLVNLKWCSVCEQTFRYLTSLFKHLINIHNVEKESINIICTKSYSDFQDVKTYKGNLYKAVCKYWIIDHDSSSFEQVIYY